MGGMFLVCC